MPFSRTPAPTRRHASFDAALQEYYKRTGYDLLSSSAASAAGVALADSPADIHTAIRLMLTNVRRSDDSRLNTTLGKVLDGLQLFNEICGELAVATQVPGGKSIFTAFGILLKTLKNYQDRKGELATLLTEVSDFLTRFAVRERLDIDSTWNHELYTRIFVNVLNVFCLVTKILKGKVGKVLRGIGAALLSNRDLKDASALLHRNITSESRWTCVEILTAVERVRQDVQLSRAMLDFANSTLITTHAAVEASTNKNTIAHNATTSTLEFNTVVLNSHTHVLSAIHANVLERVVFVRSVGTTPGTSYWYPTPTPLSTAFSIHPPTPAADVNAITVARDAVVVSQRFTATLVTGEICVPLSCSLLLAMAMSPNLPFLFRLTLANMISFFMWNQVMMPRRVTFMATIVTWTSRFEVPLSAVRDFETYRKTVRQLSYDAKTPEQEVLAPWNAFHRDSHLLMGYHFWTASPGEEIHHVISQTSDRTLPRCPYCIHPQGYWSPGYGLYDLICVECNNNFVAIARYSRKPRSFYVHAEGGSTTYLSQRRVWLSRELLVERECKEWKMKQKQKHRRRKMGTVRRRQWKKLFSKL